MQLGRDVFLALSSVIWADGRVTPSEAAALLDSARASGVTGDDLAAVEAATRTRSEEVGRLELDDEQKLFVYGIAVWLAGVDGIFTPDEEEVIRRLGDTFGLSEEDRAMLWAAARASAPEGMQRDVSTLADAIKRSASAG